MCALDLCTLNVNNNFHGNLISFTRCIHFKSIHQSSCIVLLSNSLDSNYVCKDYSWRVVFFVWKLFSNIWKVVKFIYSYLLFLCLCANVCVWLYLLTIEALDNFLSLSLSLQVLPSALFCLTIVSPFNSTIYPFHSHFPVVDGLCNVGNWSNSLGRVIIFCRVE